MKPFIVNSQTELYAILGDPISHSMSPVIHNNSFRRLGMDKVFIAMRCDIAHIDEMMRSLRIMGLKGYVFTMPLKEMVAEHIDLVKDEAAITGAINCVQNEGNRLIGYNTDSLGFWSAVCARNTTNKSINRVFILGMGGFAKAAAAQAALRGVDEIVTVNRMEESRYVESFRAFVERLQEKAPDCKVRLLEWDTALWGRELSGADVVVNATPNGLNDHGDLHLQFPYSLVKADAIFFDAIYTPLKTKFLARAQERGYPIVDGLDLLAHQGVCSFKIWTGADVTPEMMREDGLRFIVEHTK